MATVNVKYSLILLMVKNFTLNCVRWSVSHYRGQTSQHHCLEGFPWFAFDRDRLLCCLIVVFDYPRSVFVCCDSGSLILLLAATRLGMPDSSSVC